ncbi:hypothetical protein ACVWYF_002062 [Hymenobacter sp. UYAg731]
MAIESTLFSGSGSLPVCLYFQHTGTWQKNYVPNIMGDVHGWITFCDLLREASAGEGLRFKRIQVAAGVPLATMRKYRSSIRRKLA